MLSALPEEHIHVISLSEGENGSGSDTTTRVAPESPKKDPADRSGSESPTSDLERETTVGDAAAQGKWAHQLRWDIARHAVGEEIIVFPLMEDRLGQRGKELVKLGRAGHQVSSGVRDIRYFC